MDKKAPRTDWFSKQEFKNLGDYEYMVECLETKFSQSIYSNEIKEDIKIINLVNFAINNNEDVSIYLKDLKNISDKEVCWEVDDEFGFSKSKEWYASDIRIRLEKQCLQSLRASLRIVASNLLMEIADNEDQYDNETSFIIKFNQAKLASKNKNYDKSFELYKKLYDDIVI